MALKQRALDRTTPPQLRRASTSHPTSYWPSSKPSDYADNPSTVTPARQHRPARYRHNLGIGVMDDADSRCQPLVARRPARLLV
jgi:hypothetical protein